MRCSDCGRDNPEGNEFCGHFGVNLGFGYDEVRYDRGFWAITIVGTILIILASYLMNFDPWIGLVTILSIFLIMLFLLAYLRRIMTYHEEMGS